MASLSVSHPRSLFYSPLGLISAGPCASNSPQSFALLCCLRLKDTREKADPAHGSRWLELSHQQPLRKFFLLCLFPAVGMEIVMVSAASLREEHLMHKEQLALAGLADPYPILITQLHVRRSSHVYRPFTFLIHDGLLAGLAEGRLNGET